MWHERMCTQLIPVTFSDLTPFFLLFINMIFLLILLHMDLAGAWDYIHCMNVQNIV